MTGIIWLASYPKSGNTWLRMFLAHLVAEEASTITINNFIQAFDRTIGIASNRQLFDELSGIEGSDLLPDEIDLLRPRVYERVAAELHQPVFAKVHDALLPTPTGEPLFSKAATRAIVYIVRNPFDVAISLSHFMATDLETAISNMANRNFAFSQVHKRLPSQLRQRLSSWSGHVESWLDSGGHALHVIRYEDMVRTPVETFSAVARFLELPVRPGAIRQAVDATRFETLRAQEEVDGFIERPPVTERFFRSGRIGEWRERMSSDQVARIVAAHGAAMRRLGYIDAQNRICI